MAGGARNIHLYFFLSLLLHTIGVDSSREQSDPILYRLLFYFCVLS